jgi:5-methyltetrahydropteroyltriglutamate--homocysteine methyltransferase
MLLPTTLVGSYAQPEWLIDRAKLAGRFPPRVRARELWRIPEPFLAEAQDDATVLAIKAQEEAGLDIPPTAKCAARAIRTVSPPR